MVRVVVQLDDARRVVGLECRVVVRQRGE